MISGSVSAGAWEQAVDVFMELRRQGLQPNLITQNALLRAGEASFPWEFSTALVRRFDDTRQAVHQDRHESCLVPQI